MRTLSGALLAGIALAGCAIGAVPTNLATPVAPARWGQAQPGTGLLILKRDNEITGSGCKFAVSVDGVEIGRLRIRERFNLHLPEGEHHIAGKCPGTDRAELFVTIAAGETSVYRIRALPSALLATSLGFTIQRTAY